MTAVATTAGTQAGPSGVSIGVPGNYHETVGGLERFPYVAPLVEVVLNPPRKGDVRELSLETWQQVLELGMRRSRGCDGGHGP